jgi:glycosyltransferase involved in cell wall biosynthesis
MSNKTLFFFTSSFPYGKEEAFIEAEFPFLSKSFDRIHIISNSPASHEARHVSENVIVHYLPYNTTTQEKINGILRVDWLEVLSETKRFSKGVTPFKIIQSCVSAYSKALSTSNYLSSLIEREKIDIRNAVFYSYWLNNMALGLCLFKSENPEANIVSRAHGWDVYFERHNPPYLPFRKLLFDSLDACYAISQNGQEYLQKFTNAKEKIKISRLGTLKRVQSALKPCGKFHIVSCSSIIPLKRVHLIVEALSHLKDVPIVWRHFGGGQLANELQSLAVEKLSSDAVEFEFMGQVNNVQIHDFYSSNKVDLFINVSEFEGLPVSIMEALRYSIPVIATNVGGVNEIIKNDFNGLLLSANPEPAEVANAISKFIGLSAEAKEKFNQNAFEFWNTNYNAENNYADFTNRLLGL